MEGERYGKGEVERGMAGMERKGGEGEEGKGTPNNFPPTASFGFLEICLDYIVLPSHCTSSSSSTEIESCAVQTTLAPPSE